MQLERVDKLIASQGKWSRKDVKSLIKCGRVLCNGCVIKNVDQKINIGVDEISIDGKMLEYSKYIYIMLNKPKGVVSATNDNVHKTVLDLIPDDLWRNDLFPAGRLDKDTEGFVLITNDGDFAHYILSPKHHIPKTYIAVLDKPITQSIIFEFESGMNIDSGDVCKPASVKSISEDGCTVEVILVEGMYHQIKRMFAHVGINVLELKRVKMGNLELDKNLKSGECKKIVHKDVDNILCK